MITIFYHVYREGAFWPLLVHDQMQRLHKSGLYTKASQIFINAVGPGQSLSWLKADYPKVTIIESYKNTFECMTIQQIQAFSKENPEALIFYLHTKGVTHKRSSVRDWRLLMEHFCIDRWETCVNLLTTQHRSTVGVNLHLEPIPHYSGNFWWSTAAHINTLDPISLDNRMNAEFFLLSKDVSKSVCFYESAIDHYQTTYPETLYDGLDDSTCLDRSYSLLRAHCAKLGVQAPEPPTNL